MKWIFFSYSLPAEPSKARVYVWRQLRRLGAVNYQSIWAVPHARERVEALKKLTEDIANWKGKALLVAGAVLVESQEEDLKAAFMKSRNEEYTEILGKCEDYLKEIEFEIERRNFIFAEVEENEVELEKLKQWLKKVEKRDLIKPPLRKAALDKIRECERRFEDFARKVFENQSQPQRSDP